MGKRTTSWFSWAGWYQISPGNAADPLATPPLVLGSKWSLQLPPLSPLKTPKIMGLAIEQ